MRRREPPPVVAEPAEPGAGTGAPGDDSQHPGLDQPTGYAEHVGYAEAVVVPEHLQHEATAGHEGFVDDGSAAHAGYGEADGYAEHGGLAGHEGYAEHEGDVEHEGYAEHEGDVEHEGLVDHEGLVEHDGLLEHDGFAEHEGHVEHDPYVEHEGYTEHGAYAEDEGYAEHEVAADGSPLGLPLTTGGEHAFQPPVRRRRSGAAAKLLVVLAVAVALVVGAIFTIPKLVGSGSSTGSTASDDFPGPGSGRVLVTVPTGATASTIGDLLAQAGVVKTAQAFADAADADPSSDGIQPGSYALRRGMSGAQAVTALLDPSSIAGGRVTIPEGTFTAYLLQIVAAHSTVPLAQLRAASQQLGALGMPAYGQKTVEGFLFPSTYDIPSGTTGVAALRMMTARFQTEAQTLGLVAGARARHVTPLQVVTIASIIEREVSSASDRGRVAEVIYNRLARPAQFPYLGLESTVRYALGNVVGTLTQSQLATKSPYNTYAHAGLPPGPIGNPGEAALQAALHPTPGQWLYFLTDRKGVTHFYVNNNDFINAEHANGLR